MALSSIILFIVSTSRSGIYLHTFNYLKFLFLINLLWICNQSNYTNVPICGCLTYLTHLANGFKSKFFVTDFIRFLKTFDVDKYKFGEISINRRVNMQDITIGAYNTKNLIKQAHKIKSIDAANSLYFEENKESTLKIIDKVIIKECWWDEERTDKIIKLINHKSDKNYSNSNILQLFERFKFDFYKMISSKFRLINISLPFWEKLEFKLSLSSDLEIVTNPILYQNGVGSLTFKNSNNDIHISDNLISNIWKIKPKSVWI